jgi:hypothetical protein
MVVQSSVDVPAVMVPAVVVPITVIVDAAAPAVAAVDTIQQVIVVGDNGTNVHVLVPVMIAALVLMMYW